MTAPTAAQYSVNLRVRLDNVPGVLGRFASAIGEAGGNIFAIDGFVAKGPTLERDIVVNCRSVEHQQDIIDLAGKVDGVVLIEAWDRTFRMHEGGKIEVLSLCPVPGGRPRRPVDGLHPRRRPGLPGDRG
jgi:malate dehydrogenase (oxaloacetate-decarboxylating)